MLCCALFCFISCCIIYPHHFSFLFLFSLIPHLSHCTVKNVELTHSFRAFSTLRRLYVFSYLYVSVTNSLDVVPLVVCTKFLYVHVLKWLDAVSEDVYNTILVCTCYQLIRCSSYRLLIPILVCTCLPIE